MAQVILDQLVKAYPNPHGEAVRAVDGVSLAVQDGEFLVLVGPSGCGKSTTLRMIAGLEEITSGEVRIDGRVVNAVPPKDRDIAMVFQNYALYPHMSVYENMAFGLKLRKMPKGEIEGRVREAAAMLGLEGLLKRRPKALSGGQRQRVALGRAIVRKPKVFLFDEPLSNLDAKMRVATRMELARLRERLKATMIYVTHDQVEAMTLGDRICVMRDGRIEQLDAPLALYHEPATMYVAGFIGSPPMNFFRGTVRRSGGVDGAGGGWTLGEIALGAPPPAAEGREVVLGLRPEHLALRAAGPLKATVEIFEPMGAEAYLHAKLGGTTFVARVPPETHVSAGQTVSFAADFTQARWFDPATEKRI